MAGVEGTKDNEAESRFGKVNNSRQTDKETADRNSIRPLQFKSGPSSGRLCPDLCIVFWDNLTAILKTSDRGLGAAQNNKETTWIQSRRKEAAHENSAAAVSDTEGSKSLHFSTSKWVYFCFPQLNLENRFSQNFDYWQLYSLADNTVLFNLLLWKLWDTTAPMSCPHAHCIKSTYMLYSYSPTCRPSLEQIRIFLPSIHFY